MAYNNSRPAKTGKDNKGLDKLEQETRSQLPLGRNNFIWMAISAALIVVGFLLMLGGSSTTESFNPDIFSARRIVVGPTIAFIGFITMGISIIIKPKDKKDSNAG